MIPADLAEGWRKVIATRDASPADCECRAVTGPLIAEWIAFSEGTWDVDKMARQWSNLRAAQAAQNAVDALPAAGGDFEIDVRSPAEFAAKPRAAKNIPIDDLSERIGEIPRAARVVAFCASGARAARAVHLLRAAGFRACNGHEETCELPADPALGSLFGNVLWSDEWAAYKRLDDRWSAMLRWNEGHPGAGKPIAATSTFLAWMKYKADHDGPIAPHPTPEELRGLMHDLQSAEGQAQLSGYSNPPDVPALTDAQKAPSGAPKAPEQVKVPTFAEQHKTAVGIDENAPKPPPDPSKDPYFAAKVGGVAALGLGTLAGALAAKGETARVGIAIGGSILTAGAAWFAFKPADEKPEKKP